MRPHPMRWTVAFVLTLLFALAGVLEPGGAQQQPQSASAVLGASAAANACTPSACVTLPSTGALSTGWAEVSGTFTGTLVAEILGASGTAYQVPLTVYASGSASTASSVSAPALVSFPIGPAGTRIRMSAYTSGTAIVTLYATAANTGAAALGPSAGTQNVNLAAQSLSPIAVTTPAPCTSATCSTAVTNANAPCFNTTPTAVAINVSTATTTQLVALAANKAVYVCELDFIAAGTTNATTEYGTGAACGTGTTPTSGAYPLAAQVGMTRGNGLGVVDLAPAGNAYCLVTSAAVQLSGHLVYVQG